jgi:hypothetical protein
MREARLVGLSQDGKQLILAMAETGEEFAVPVDDRMRAALRGDRARLGQLEIQMESALRPRDIQARIRAGESPEAVAAVAQMPMERVMAFAGPVLAERDHIASLAQRASVRRRGGGDAPARNLGTWVTERLRVRHVDPASAEWDAWRREDGRWAVRVSYFVETEDAGDDEEKKDEKIAMFAYDAPGRYAVPDDDEARWLVGEQVQVIPPPVQPVPQNGERRLTAVADIDLTVAPDHSADSYEAGFEDTVSLPRRNHPVSRESETGPRRVHSVPNPDEEPTLIDVPVEQPPSLRPAVRAVERAAQPPAEFAPAEERRATPERGAAPERGPAPVRQAPESRAPAERPAKPEPAPVQEEAPELSEPAAAVAEAESAVQDEASAEPKKKPARRGKRASVPSWDEIMFGKKAD